MIRVHPCELQVLKLEVYYRVCTNVTYIKKDDKTSAILRFALR